MQRENNGSYGFDNGIKRKTADNKHNNEQHGETETAQRAAAQSTIDLVYGVYGTQWAAVPVYNFSC